MNCTLSDNQIRIIFPENPDLQHKVMTLQGRTIKDTWYAPPSLNNLNLLKDWGFSLDGPLQKIIDESLQKEREIIKIPSSLYPFQKEGVAFIETQNGKCLLAHEMGCGKSVITLSWLKIHKESLKPIVILCPASLKLNWKRETEKWLTQEIEVLKGIKTYPTTKDVLILNYDILHYWLPEIKKRNPKVIILDEVTAVKQNTARRTKAIKKLKDVPHIIGLTGTPIMNRRLEMFNILQLIDPHLFPLPWNLTSLTNEELHQKLKYKMIRKLKKDVLPELPDKTFSFIPIELDNVREYQKAEKDFIEFVRQEKGDAAAERIRRVEALAKIEGLKQLATKGKMKQVIEWIKGVDEKLVVFCTHKIVVDTLMNEFSDAVKIDGSVSMNERQKAVDEFQNGDTKLFVGNILAAGEGLTLTASSNLALIELPWSPMQVSQAIGRIDRIGQKNAMNIYFLLASGTIEERIAMLLDKKQKEIDATIDGEDTPEENLLVELMNSYK